MFKSPFSFEGRIRRTEYGLSYIIYIFSAGILSVLMDINEATLFLGLGYIPLFWFFIAQGAKRCHDRGNNGWYQIIPFYGLWMLFADSDFGQNKYGPNPKGIGNIDEIDELGQHLVG
jgi:uncharacterized membrane protein YhaH (DUF805 family)